MYAFTLDVTFPRNFIALFCRDAITQVIYFNFIFQLDLSTILDLYQKIRPALHPHMDNPAVLNTGALMYAVRRLPSNVSRTHLFILGRQRPMVLDPHGIMLLTSSPARRRAVWDMQHGMSFVLMSDPLTDLVDLTTCLSCYCIETKKIRNRLTNMDPQVGVKISSVRI